MSLAPFAQIDLEPFTQALSGASRMIAQLAAGVADAEKRGLITELGTALEEHKALFLRDVPAGLEKAKARYEAACQEYDQLQSKILEIRQRKADLVRKLQAVAPHGHPGSAPPTAQITPLPAAGALPDFSPAEELRTALLQLGQMPAPPSAPLPPGRKTTGNIWENWNAHPFGTGGPDPDHGEDHEHDHPSEQ